MNITALSHRRAQASCAGLSALLLWVLPLTGHAFWGNTLAMEPQPFRQERVLESRTFQYNDESFIHRSSFASTPAEYRSHPLPQDHIEGVGGSSRSDELFLDASARATQRFDRKGTVDFQYRFRRTEDYDGRYSRNLVGFGIHPGGGIQARLMADAQGDKARIDLQPELGWQDRHGNAVRVALVMPDYVFNEKQNEAHYADTPRTLFSAAQWHASDVTSLKGYISLSPETELEIPSRDSLFREESAQGGFSLQHRFNKDASVRWLIEGAFTDRHQNGLSSSASASMERRVWRSRAILTYAGGRVERWRLGGEFLSLAESGQLIGDARQLSDRDEYLAFIGFGQSLSPEWQFSPELFVAHVNGYSLNGLKQRYSDHDGNYIKASLPFSWAPQGKNGPRLTLNPSVELHEPGFGGGNLRIRIPL
ncbi:hypothetical protein [Salicola sp. Rm-C-2C1-2]|uniref:hypothetical protein n=1 Tax=Salicola sp. Rm-C-2C1-2 TaxID=3141321 RepID=UPI0032E4B85D